MNVSNEEGNNVSNGCLSELERVNDYFYLGNNKKWRERKSLAVTRKIGLGFEGIQRYVFSVVNKTHMNYQRTNL